MENFNFKLEYVNSIASVGKAIGAGLLPLV